jgi:hypothetical protein
MELSQPSRLGMWSLVLASQLIASGALRAQQHPPWPADRIGGIGALPWGATAKDVEAVSGSYLMSRAAGDTGLVLIFRNRVAGTPVTTLFYLDHIRGLVRGVFSVPYGVGDECEVVFETFKGFVQRLYPTLKPVERRTHVDRSLPFCSAANLDKASWTVDWTDAAGNKARVSLDSGDGRITTTFTAGRRLT